MALLIPSLENDMNDYYYDPLRLNRRIIPSIFPRKSWLDDFGFILHPQQEQRLHNIQRKLGIVAENAATVNKDGFHVCVDVHQFKPEEISLRTSDRYITIEGKHEEREDEHGYITRQFSRRYALPAGFDPASVTSEMSSDGILSIKAPKPAAIEGEIRLVPIKLTEVAHVNHAIE